MLQEHPTLIEVWVDEPSPDLGGVLRAGLLGSKGGKNSSGWSAGSYCDSLPQSCMVVPGSPESQSQNYREQDGEKQSSWNGKWGVKGYLSLCGAKRLGPGKLWKVL